MKYKLFFDDKTEFNGGDPTNSSWNMAPNKPIERMEYYLDNHKVVMTNFEEYNHNVEWNKTIGTKAPNLGQLLLMGSYMGKVYLVRVSFYTGKIYKEVLERGSEYRGKPISGWKQGIKSDRVLPKITINGNDS